MEIKEIVKILRYCKPSKMAKPRGFPHRMEKWEQIVLEFSLELSEADPKFVNEHFLIACGFFDDVK